MNMARRIARFGRFVVHHTRGQAVLALLFLLFSSITESLSILMLIPLLHLIGPGGAADVSGIPLLGALPRMGFRFELGPLLIGFILLVVAQSLFARFKTLYMTETMQLSVDRIRMQLFHSIGMARWGAIARTRTSDLNHALMTDIDRIQVATFNLLNLVQSVIMLVVYAAIATLVSIRMTLFATVVGGVVLAALFPMRRFAAQHGQVLTTAMQERQRTYSEFLAGMKMAKAFNTEPRYFAELRQSLDRVRAHSLRYARLSNASNSVFQVTSTIAAAAFIYVAFTRFHMPLARVGVMLIIFMRITPRFNAIQTALQALATNLIAFESVQAMIRTFNAERESAAEEDSETPPLLAQAIVFDGVAMRYGADTPPVLEDASFVIPAGRITAVIGPSGSGKSTIADLIMGLLEPSAGRITIDGALLGHRNRRGWREQIAYVPQEVILLHDSIAANMAVAAPDADEAAMWAALEAANARDFVERLPERLETVVGDRGLRLSGGERQRIALARGLLRRPRLLILDEATSALDWENQMLIARSIERLRGSMTIITIAHRPSMISFADWVVTVEDGRIVETGDYATLIARRESRLRRLVEGEQVLEAPESKTGREPF